MSNLLASFLIFLLITIMFDYGMVFLTGLFASLHCVGMCGALVLAYSATTASSSPGNRKAFAHGALLHGAYNLGRILSYAAIGAILSTAALRLTWIRDAGSYVSIVAGIVMLFAGAAMIGLLRLPARFAFSGVTGLSRRWFAKLIRGSTPAHTLGLGLLTPLLPCGILYGMFARAAAASSTTEGAVIMGVFASGMTPSLFALGSVSTFFSARVRKGAERLAALSIILMGIILILRGFHVPLFGLIEGPGQSCCTPPQ